MYLLLEMILLKTKNTHLNLLIRKISAILVALLYSGLISSTNSVYANPAVYLSGAPGRVAQSVTYLATDASLTADPGVASSIPAQSILLWRLIMK